MVSPSKVFSRRDFFPCTKQTASYLEKVTFKMRPLAVPGTRDPCCWAPRTPLWPPRPRPVHTLVDSQLSAPVSLPDRPQMLEPSCSRGSSCHGDMKPLSPRSPDGPQCRLGVRGWDVGWGWGVGVGHVGGGRGGVGCGGGGWFGVGGGAWGGLGAGGWGLG